MKGSGDDWEWNSIDNEEDWNSDVYPRDLSEKGIQHSGRSDQRKKGISEPGELTLPERYIAVKRKRRTGRIILWMILVEVVGVALCVAVFVISRDNPNIEELLSKKVKIEYETETELVLAYGLAVPRPDIDVQLLSINEWSRPGIKVSSIEKIVIHYLGNPGTTAQENRDYFESLKNLKDTYMSANYVIGIDGQIIQCVPDGEVAWASNKANYYSISIENCHPDSTGMFTEETYWSNVHLVAYLTEKYGLGRDDIIRHYDVTGKICPKWFVDYPDDWEQFKDDVMEYRDECEELQSEMIYEYLHMGEDSDQTEQDILRAYLDSMTEESEVEAETSNQSLWDELKKRAEAYAS